MTLAKTPLEKFAYALLIHSAGNDGHKTILEVLAAFLERDSEITMADVRLILAALIDLQQHPAVGMKQIVYRIAHFDPSRAGAAASA